MLILIPVLIIVMDSVALVAAPLGNFLWYLESLQLDGGGRGVERPG